MTKDELIKKVSGNIDGATQKDVKVVIDEFIDVIINTVANDEPVKISGFGTFDTVTRGERTGRNPSTNEEIVIPASKSPHFKAFKNFKEIVKGQ